MSLQSLSSSQACEIVKTAEIILRPKGCVSYDIVSWAGLFRHVGSRTGLTNWI